MARCFNDTCSITVTEENIGDGNKFSANVNTDELRGIECVEPDGLRVKLSEDDAEAVGCYNTLRRTAAGDLHAITNPARLLFGNGAQDIQYSVAGTYRGVPNLDDVDDGKSSASITHNIVNPYACDAILLVEGRFEFNFQISDEPLYVGTTDTGADDHISSVSDPTNADIPSPQENLTGYNANVKCALVIAGQERVVNYMPVSGIINVDTTTQTKRDWRNFSYRHLIGASASLAVTDYCQYQGPDQNLNVQAAGADANSGFRSVVQYTIIPMTGAV